MKLPRLDPETRRVYEAALPPDPRIRTRSMFGGLGSFVNGNMFAGVLGQRIFLRLPEAHRVSLLKEPGGGPFEPIQGHAMPGYAVVPEPWMRDADRIHLWLGRALEWVGAMPPKAKGAKKPRKG